MSQYKEHNNVPGLNIKDIITSHVTQYKGYKKIKLRYSGRKKRYILVDRYGKLTTTVKMRRVDVGFLKIHRLKEKSINH